MSHFNTDSVFQKKGDVMNEIADELDATDPTLTRTPRVVNTAPSGGGLLRSNAKTLMWAALGVAAAVLLFK